MKITSSTVALASQRQFQSSHQMSLNIKVEQRSALPQTSSQADRVASLPSRVSLSSMGLSKASQSSGVDDGEIHDMRLILIKSLVEMLTGHSFKLIRLPSMGQASSATTNDATTQAAAQQESTPEIQIDYQESQAESEQVAFQAVGVVQTSDGREISFQAELSMARSYSEQLQLHADNNAGRRKMDPLILNYQAPAASLSSDTFAFDLNADGSKENLNLLNQGSAYLALDLNQNAKIDDGSELFGTRSGDGFADLAQYDSDNNRWIDENDAVFAQLKLWVKDASGQDQLLDLKSMGIGAIYLGKASADFSLMDSRNQEMGQSRAAGVYLNEDGSGGTVQQIDLVA